MSNTSGAHLPAKFKPYSNSIAVGLSAVLIGLVSKHVFKRETLPVGSMGKMGMTFIFVTASSLLGEEAMYQAKTKEVIH